MTTLPDIVVTPTGRVEPVTRSRGTQSPPADVVVTPTGRVEPIGRTVGTTQVITRETIERSTGKSITDLFAENAVGFLSEWTPGQTSINIRGGATEGQGRDFRSQVLVLINGHRAGTANVSKLSLADIERIEIVRGPSSVVYGSQNMGGVINIIMKSGRSAPGSFADVAGGSWGLFQGRAQRGGTIGAVDYYIGASGGRRDDFHIGGGKQEVNTGWNRQGVTGAAGVQIDPNNRLDFNLRTDGVFDTGFRGSSSNIYAFEDRWNRSYDVNYTGQLPDGRVSWLFQHYGVTDVDDLNNPNPLNLGTSRTSIDHNKRELNIVGTRLQPRVKMWQGNDLLLGWDWERSWLRSDRFRQGTAGNPGISQFTPFDNNQTEDVSAFYFEDAQTLFDRWGVRGGIRRTFGTLIFDRTPFQTGSTPAGRRYQATTYSAGTTYQMFDWLSWRAGTSTGFRAPTATDLTSGSTVTFTGNTIFGNPSLRPETSTQIEAGATLAWSPWRLDVAVFQNLIKDRIVTTPRAGVANTTDTINNPGDIVVRGVEVQGETDVIKAFRIANASTWRWSIFGNGSYNFDMQDRGAAANANTHNPQRIYAYEAAIGTRFGQVGGPWRDWSVQITGLLRGPMWYDTEEAMIIEPNSTYIHQKPAFWTLNARGEVALTANTKLYVAINNILDVNQHPIFIALDQTPCYLNPTRQNGGCGNSMPGREFIVGLQARW